MDKGVWRTTIHEVTELDMTEWLTHTHTHTHTQLSHPWHLTALTRGKCTLEMSWSAQSCCLAPPALKWVLLAEPVLPQNFWSPPSSPRVKAEVLMVVSDRHPMVCLPCLVPFTRPFLTQTGPEHSSWAPIYITPSTSPSLAPTSFKSWLNLTFSMRLLPTPCLTVQPIPLTSLGSDILIQLQFFLLSQYFPLQTHPSLSSFMMFPVLVCLCHWVPAPQARVRLFCLLLWPWSRSGFPALINRNWSEARQEIQARPYWGPWGFPRGTGVKET